MEDKARRARVCVRVCVLGGVGCEWGGVSVIRAGWGGGIVGWRRQRGGGSNLVAEAAGTAQKTNVICLLLSNNNIGKRHHHSGSVTFYFYHYDSGILTYRTLFGVRFAKNEMRVNKKSPRTD